MISKYNASSVLYILFYSKVSNRLFSEFVAAKPEGRKTALGDLFSQFLFFLLVFWQKVFGRSLTCLQLSYWRHPLEPTGVRGSPSKIKRCYEICSNTYQDFKTENGSDNNTNFVCPQQN